MVVDNAALVLEVSPTSRLRQAAGVRATFYGGMGLLGLGSMAMLVTPGPLRAILGAIVVLIVPGAAVTSCLRLRSAASELLLMVVISASVGVSGGYAMSALHAWYPRLWVVVVATVSGVVLTARSARLLLQGADADAQTDPMVGAPGVRAGRLGAYGRLPRLSWSGGAVAALCGAATLLWAVALPSINPASADDAGLIGKFPIAFFLALGLVTIAFTLVVRRRYPQPLALGVIVALLVVILYATTPLIASLPRYTYVYKHLGVASYLNLHAGVTQPSLDIYQNWPGFFALLAVLERFSGISGLTLADWGQLTFALVDALAVRYVVRGLTDDERVVGLATWLYVLFDWVGQNYLSPQAFGFAVTLTAVGILLHHLPARSGTRNGQELIGGGPLRWFAGRAVPPPLAALEGPAAPRWAVAGVVVVLGVAVAVSHQLSPFMLIASVAVLLVTRRIRGWWVLAVLILLTAGQYARAFPYMLANHLLPSGITAVVSNSSGTSGTLPSSSGHLLVEHAARVLSIGVWLLAAAAVVVRRRRGYWEITAAGLLLVPFGLLGLQSYGGEAIYRVFLFTTPWCAYLVASALVGGRHPLSLSEATQPLALLHRRRTREAAGVAMLSALLIPLWLTSFYGLYRSDYVRPSELAGWDWFASHAPTGSVLDYVDGNFPANATGNYDSFELADGGGGGIALVNQPSLTGRSLGTADVPAAIALLRKSALSGPVYIALSPGQETYAEGFGLSPPGSVAHFETVLAHDPHFRTVFRQGSTQVLELRPTSS